MGMTLMASLLFWYGTGRKYLKLCLNPKLLYHIVLYKFLHIMTLILCIYIKLHQSSSATELLLQYSTLLLVGEAQCFSNQFIINHMYRFMTLLYHIYVSTIRTVSWARQEGVHKKISAQSVQDILCSYLEKSTVPYVYDSRIYRDPRFHTPTVSIALSSIS